MKRRVLILLLCLLSYASAAGTMTAATWYVDSSTGHDSDSGSSPEHAWQTLDRINGTRFRPGDRILFRAGRTWVGQLAPTGSGVEGNPIIFDSYGPGAKPGIDGQGRVEDVIRLHNIDQIEVRDLEVTNRGEPSAKRIGVHIFLDNFGTARHIVIAGLFIHDVNGNNGNGDNFKDNGGIIFRTVGDKVPSRFDGLVIERNLIRAVDRSGIAAASDRWRRSRWFPSLHVVIRDNYVDDVGGDGIVPWATDGALIEHNIVRNCNRRAGSYNAGMWPWSTDNSLFQLNEASLTRTTRDGEGFDSDFNSRNTLFQYNYSHDNEGGFMLICSPGKRNPLENIGNTGTEVRFNVSRNDHSRAFNVSGGVEHIVVHDNLIYIPAGNDLQAVLISDWSGWPADVLFHRNTFWAEDGIARYGHAVKRNDDGAYIIAPGWNGATGIIFDGNRYIGQNVNRPEDARGIIEESARRPTLDWNEPPFDTASPEGFDAFMKAHRAWMLRLFKKQFGRPVTLGQSPHQ